jgi:hypothetical protein
MSKFIKKPVVVDAEQWFRGNEIDGVVELPFTAQPHVGFIDTLEGRMMISEGDWIITGVEGEKYPCKPGIFKKTYESVPTPTELDPT